jgi:hypothetical protein
LVLHGNIGNIDIEKGAKVLKYFKLPNKKIEKYFMPLQT